MKKALLVTLADRNYLQTAKQLFSGAYWNAGWKGDYMLLSHGIPERELAWFRRKGILVRKCRPVFRESEVRRRPISVYSKFYLFTPEFRKWKNIVYLDADMIVRASLDELAAVKGFCAVPGGRLGAFVVKPGRLPFGRRNAEAKRRREDVAAAYDLTREGFNSGMMAFSTDVIKEETFPALRKLALRYSDANRYGDQLILNLLFYGRYVPLPIIYNCRPRYFMVRHRLKPGEIKAALIHCTWGGKPWAAGTPFFGEWSANLARADGIDLSRVPAPRSAPGEGEMAAYRKMLQKRRLRYFYRHIVWKATPFTDALRRGTDRRMGLLGIFLKRRSPALYSALKKTKVR